MRDLDEARLVEFIGRELPEGPYLEFKGDLPGSSERERTKGFLKSVSGFANAQGGDLFLGVKEAEGELPANSRLRGIDGGDELARRLERKATSSIDPQIPGLYIRSVPLVNGKVVVVAHVPPSLSRPHRVSYDGHVNFYVRHSEQTVPMTTHEIRDAVLNSVTAEQRAQEYLKRFQLEVRDYQAEGACTLLLQAIPIIPVERDWDLEDRALEEVLIAAFREGSDRPDEVRPSLHGLRCHQIYGDESVKWAAEAHRTGYLSLLYRERPSGRAGEPPQFSLAAEYHCVIFQGFATLCDRALQVTETDLPYLVQGTYFNTGEASLRVTEETTRAYRRPLIEFPPQVRRPGEVFAPIGERLCTLLHNAFGVHP